MTNRVAGFICKYVFSEHESCVTSLVVIERNKDLNSTYVVCLYMLFYLHRKVIRDSKCYILIMEMHLMTLK